MDYSHLYHLLVQVIKTCPYLRLAPENQPYASETAAKDLTNRRPTSLRPQLVAEKTNLGQYRLSFVEQSLIMTHQ